MSEDILRGLLEAIFAGPLAEIHQAHLDLADKVDDMRRRMANLQREGTVTDVDGEKHLVRLNLGPDENGQPVKSAWVPYAQQAGAHKRHEMPSVGQQMMLHSPDGDPHLKRAYAVPHTWSDANPSPSKDPNEGVHTFGGVTVRMKDGTHTIESNGKAVTQTNADGSASQTGKAGSKVTVDPAGSSAGVHAKSPKNIVHNSSQNVVLNGGAGGGSSQDQAAKDAIKAKALADLNAIPSAKSVNMSTTLPSGATYNYSVSRNG